MGWHRLDLGQPASVLIGYTTRVGGCSPAPWDGLNLGLGTGDVAERVVANRRWLQRAVGMPLHWLRQVHGTAVVVDPEGEPEADAACTARPGQALAVLGADCLPVMCWSRSGDWVGAAHAGWRGLAAGVLPSLLDRAPVTPGRLACWLGPAIGPAAYEVDEPVRQAFAHWSGPWRQAFRATRPGHWSMDLKALARLQLHQLGVGRVLGGTLCTFQSPERFFSHRRDGRTGRQAAVIGLRLIQPG